MQTLAPGSSDIYWDVPPLGEGIVRSDISTATQDTATHTQQNPPRKRKYKLCRAAYSDNTKVLLLLLEAVM